MQSFEDVKNPMGSLSNSLMFETPKQVSKSVLRLYITKKEAINNRFDTWKRILLER